ncbi:TetR family transcriptional regulator [Actinorhabdospora filicis]|uniref:TetR family transcriptional regulator n=1 Tax=Actinorhabdospora filicis TaxID=1785913 RepID=A0A9W6WCY4_9ACTN|nr:TetR/AcrR family transcriptional regulator C-terminal domain-containing protein [Actinorhabdospora filicis]GLZ80285.1 TetR family transcriptional regulator [Actinorhabdospora filicis]
MSGKFGAAWESGREAAPRLGRDEIVRAALELLESGGLDGFSMRKLAVALDIKSPSLYWHVKNKDELFDLVIDTVFGRCPLPGDEDVPWPERVKDVGMTWRRVLLNHPAAARLLPSRIPSGPNAMRLADHVVGILLRAGFDAKTASYGYLTLHFYVTGFACLEVAYVGGAAPGTISLDDYAGILAGLPSEDFPNLAAVSGDLLAGHLTARFEYGLGGIVDKLAKELG